VEFARVLGISSGHLSKVEAGVAPVSEDLVAMIRRRCNVQVSAGTATGSQSSPPADLVPILKAIDQRRPLGAVDKSNHYLAKMGEIQLTTLEDRLDEDVWELFLHTLNVVRRVVSTHFAFLHRLEVTLTSVLPETVATQRERFAVAEVEHALMSALEKSPDVSVEESQQSEGGGEIAVVSTANPNIRLAIGLEDLHVWGAAKRKKSELSQ
jgi:transcriptional regulator with XRE-family HTH domain